jgi:uncharacterized damage-inducible protein DinB
VSQLKVNASPPGSMIEYLRKLFLYEDWASREIWSALAASQAPSLRSIKLLAHILSAQKLWLERVKGQPQTLPIWPEYGLTQCEALIVEMAGNWRDYYQSIAETELERRVPYKNSKGEAFNSRVEDILTHVVMHGTYHRGQIAADMRASGMTPAYTDFIHAVRRSFLE